MGCQESKSENDSKENPSDAIATISNETMTHSADMKRPDIDYKSRLEWKMCLVSDSFVLILFTF